MKLYAVFSKRGGDRGNCLTRLTQYPPLCIRSLGIECFINKRVKFNYPLLCFIYSTSSSSTLFGMLLKHVVSYQKHTKTNDIS